MTEYELMGQKWLKGEVEIEEFNGIKLNPKQKEFVNDKHRFSLVSGGMASGKTLAWQIKFILITQWFPNTRILIGRKTKGNASSTFMKDFVDICPPGLYEHKIGEGVLRFTNGSEAVFFGLDALQSGSGDDLKKAVQDLKSHNFGFIFLDQLEEIEEKVHDALNSRMRRRQCKHGTTPEFCKVYRDEDDNAMFEECRVCGKFTFNQFNDTTNPANFWGYDFFKGNPRKMSNLVETSMMDNKDNLSEQFIQSELEKPELYVKKFVYGEWSPDVMTEGTVFSSDYIKDQEFNIKDPLREFDGIKIYEEPDNELTYQIGIDPSDGAVDPSCIQVVSEAGRQVAVYSGFIPIHAITEKAMVLANMYTTKAEPLIIPESTGIGQGLIENLIPRWENIYEREVFNQRERKTLKKLGFYTSYATKQQLIENAKELFQKKFLKIQDKQTLSEFKTFIYQDAATMKGAGAQTNYHDDRLMALLLAFWNMRPVTLKEQELLAFIENKKKKPIKYQYA